MGYYISDLHLQTDLLIFFREGQNVARPLALLDDSYSTDKVCQNLIPVIRHLTGSSVRSIVECHRHKSFKNLGDKNEHVKRFEDKFIDLKAEEREVIIVENQKYQEKQDEVVKKLKPCSLPENEPVLKFRLINFLSTESVLDYALVYGDDIDALSIQTFIKVSESKLTNVALTSVLVDAMAAFCRLRSAANLYSVSFFKGDQFELGYFTRGHHRRFRPKMSSKGVQMYFNHFYLFK